MSEISSIVTKPAWRVSGIIHDVEIKIRRMDEGQTMGTPPPEMPSSVRAKIHSECTRCGAEDEDTEKFLKAIEYAYWPLLGCLADHQLPSVISRDALDALYRLQHAIEDVVSSGAIIPLYKASDDFLIMESGKPTGFLPGLSRQVRQAIQLVEETHVKKGAPAKDNRRQFVEAGMILWKKYTKLNATMSEGRGFAKVLTEIWNWMHTSNELSKEVAPSFRNDMRWLKEQGRKG